MDLTEIMSSLRVKLDAQSAALQSLLQSSLDSHSVAILNTLRQHLLSIEAKTANLSAEKSTADSNPAMTVSRSLKLNTPSFVVEDDLSNIEDFVHVPASTVVDQQQVMGPPQIPKPSSSDAKITGSASFVIQIPGGYSKEGGLSAVTVNQKCGVDRTGSWSLKIPVSPVQLLESSDQKLHGVCPFAADASIDHTVPYDPGPLNPPPLALLLSAPTTRHNIARGEGLGSDMINLHSMGTSHSILPLCGNSMFRHANIFHEAFYQLFHNVFATANGNPLIFHNFRMKFSFTHTHRIWGVGPVSIIAWSKYATNCRMSFIGSKQELDHSIQIGQHVQMNGGGDDNIHDASIPSGRIKHQGDWKYSTFDNFETKALEKVSKIVAHGAFRHSGKDAVDQNLFPMMRMMHEAAFNLASDLKCEFAGAVFAVSASKLNCEVAAVNAFAATYPYQSRFHVSNTAQFMGSIEQAEKQLTTLNSVKPKLNIFKFVDHLEYYYFPRNPLDQRQLVQQYAYIDPCSIDGAQLSFTAAFDVVSAYVSLDDGSKHVLHLHWCGVASTILENPNIIIGLVITEMKDSGFQMLAFASRQTLVPSKDDILLVQEFITSELGIEVLIECGCLEGKQLKVLNDKAHLFDQVSVIGIFAVKDKLLMITDVVNSLDIDTHDPILVLGERGSCYFSFTNGSLHFKIWDPGGCCSVLWEGLAKLKVSWEDFAAFKEAYPTFHLEDKVSFEGVGNDTTPLWARARMQTKRLGQLGQVNQTHQPSLVHGHACVLDPYTSSMSNYLYSPLFLSKSFIRQLQNMPLY